jgi:DNA-binding LacI/PurR family transcriptional regulator
MLSRAIPDGTSDWLERMTGSGMVDGVLLIGQSDQFEVIEGVARHYRPLVAWGSSHDGQSHCAVGTDNVLGGRIAAEHLIASGARSLAFMGEIKGIEIVERWQGAEAVAKEAGLPIVQIPISLASDDMAQQIAEASRSADQTIDGIIAASDLIAMNVLRCLHEKGRKVPDEVQIIGFDDLPLASMTMPPLTTIRQEIAKGAHVMVEKLKALVQGEQTGCMKMPPQLVKRGSTRAA